jgi:hypothetical protein
MEGLKFSVKRGTLMGIADSAYMGSSDLQEVLKEGVIETLSTEIEVTVSGVTMHLAAWLNPDHWSDDWREHAGDEDADEYVFGLLQAAVEER